MSSELEVYKQTRINNLILNYQKSISSLNYKLVIDYRRIIYSRLRNKRAIINSLIASYNYNVFILKRNLNNAIKQVNQFQPDFNVITTSTTKKKALLIGINYIDTPYTLAGCIDDTNRMKDLLTQQGFESFQTLTDLTSIKPTKQNILNEFKNIIINSQAGDILFLYFSGHGSYTYDRNGDETDGKDEMIISSDLQGVFDDELKNILSNHLKREVTIVGLFDSCHSGTMFDLKFNYLDSNNYDKYTENDRVSECNGNVIMISGCMDAQTSAESQIDNKPQGAMTWSFIESINKTPNCSWRELLKSMRDLLKTNSFSQIPQLSTDSFYDIDSKLFI